MRALIQRVRQATVAAEEGVRSIGPGLLVLLGVEAADTEDEMLWLAGKLVRLRVFDDRDGVMNVSVREAGGGLLVVSQFTLFASTRKGNRPSYSRAAPPAAAQPIYERFLQVLESEFGKPVESGFFGAHMEVKLVNDGPVTILIDTKLRE